MLALKSTRPNFRRLAILARHLRKVSPKKFDIRFWSGCGATACAFGHACSIPAFKKAGLRLVTVLFKLKSPRFDGLCGYAAANAFFTLQPFGMTTRSEWLFSPNAYSSGNATTAKEVARRIENFIRKESRK